MAAKLVFWYNIGSGILQWFHTMFEWPFLRKLSLGQITSFCTNHPKLPQIVSIQFQNCQNYILIVINYLYTIRVFHIHWFIGFDCLILVCTIWDTEKRGSRLQRSRFWNLKGPNSQVIREINFSIQICLLVSSIIPLPFLHLSVLPIYFPA